ncbi:MAG TPA: sialidase family protein [Gemmatimonadales bacterium]
MHPARWAVAATLFASAASTPSPAPMLEFSGPPGSAKPFLTTTPSGGLLATWFEPRDSGRFALRIANRREGRWSPLATVALRPNFFVNWADFPSAVETADGRWIVHWLEKTATKSYAYHIRLSVSADRGASWSEPVTPHSDRSTTEHGFVAMLPRPSGGADLIWLDGRQTAQGGSGAERGSMALAAGAIDASGRVLADTLLDRRTCDCCQTALARSALGLLAAYRDRSDAEVRDIAIIRQVNGRWTKPAPVAVDGWVYRACPVNGPSIAADGQQVAVAWYTGAQETPRVKLARSRDAGASFAAPVQVDDGSPMGRSEVELLPDGSVVAIWLEQVGDRAEWRAKQFRPDGRVGERWTVGEAAATREAGFARAARLGKHLYVAWTAPGPQGGVRIHRLSLP